jgi:hypothetical protein
MAPPWRSVFPSPDRRRTHRAFAEALDGLCEARSVTITISMCSRDSPPSAGGIKPEAMEALIGRVGARQKKLRRRAKSEFDRLFDEARGRERGDAGSQGGGLG